MSLITETDMMFSDGPSAVALGFFDGVHAGHREVIKTAVNNGRDLLPAVFTFSDSPKPDTRLICTPEERFRLIEDLGVKLICAPAFSDMRRLSPEDFFAFLRDRLHAATLCFGEDYRFGRGAAGDAGLLEKLCAGSGIAAVKVARVEKNGETVSSTAIRLAVEDGDMGKAAVMLGRPFTVTGPVLHGKNLGHFLGFATVNQIIGNGLVQPKYGVYAGDCELFGKRFATVTNYGSRPTAGQESVAAETHIIGFDGDLYDSVITIALRKYLRPQFRFPSLDGLAAQIAKDVAEAEKR